MKSDLINLLKTLAVAGYTKKQATGIFQNVITAIDAFPGSLMELVAGLEAERAANKFGV